MWRASPPSPEKVDDFRAARSETGIGSFISHDTYLVNLCHSDEAVAQKSAETLRDEMLRCSQYGIALVVSHMGALVGQELDLGLRRISEKVDWILGETPEDVTLCMETTAGQGSAVNSRFEELAELLRLCKGAGRLAVCVDTCHIFAAGYDIRTRETYEQTMGRFSEVVGLDRLKAIHLNDSKKGLGSKVDRHDNIGKGVLGLEPFRFIVNDARLQQVPMVVETPIENNGHAADLERLRGLFESG
jgi:deoxyribonuclease-4